MYTYSSAFTFILITTTAPDTQTFRFYIPIFTVHTPNAVINICFKLCFVLEYNQMRILNQWNHKYELSLVIESHSQFLDHENNTQNTKVSINHLSDHLKLLNNHVNTEKVPLYTYYRKKTFETQVTDFWSITYCRLIKT